MNPHRVGVIGAGAMGVGIAQLAATFGARVVLFDVRERAATSAVEGVRRQLDKRVAEGKLTSQARDEVSARLLPVSSLDQLKDCTLAIEAIVESLGPKQELLNALESLLVPTAILASNTSSLSISALAVNLKHPQRMVGMHFFNPVHSMKLVEVVAGVDTDQSVVDAVVTLARAWGKTAVVAQSTPGFIVNRIARPFYAEALALIHEHRADPETIDALIRDAGFRMGPCELMDLIGHDVNLAVTKSMFNASYNDRRFTPSWVQQNLVDSGRLGRKTGRGFYAYPRQEDASASTSDMLPIAGVMAVAVRGESTVAEHLFTGFQRSAVPTTRQPGGAAALDFVLEGELLLSMLQTDGRTARELAVGRPNGCAGVFDWQLMDRESSLLGVAYSDAVLPGTRRGIAAACKSAGLSLIEIPDNPGMLVARTISMLINEAADAVQQCVCTEADADLAMRLGVNYPAGPFEWLHRFGADAVIDVLQHLSDYYRGERYRISPWLQERRWRELALSQ